MGLWVADSQRSPAHPPQGAAWPLKSCEDKRTRTGGVPEGCRGQGRPVSAYRKLAAHRGSPHFSDKPAEASESGRLHPAAGTTLLPECTGAQEARALLRAQARSVPRRAPESSSLSGHCSQPHVPGGQTEVQSGQRAVAEARSPATLPGCGALVSWCHSSGCGAWGPSKWKPDRHGHVAV